MLFQKKCDFQEKAELTARVLQKELVFEGLPLVTLSLSLPSWQAKGAVCARINAYYEKIEKAMVQDAQKRLLPIAAAQYGWDRQNSAPLKPVTVGMSYQVLWNKAALLSIYWERSERMGEGSAFVTGYADVWDLRIGRPLPARYWFPEIKNIRKKLRRAVTQTAKEQAEKKAFPYDSALSRRVKSHFKLGQACPAEQGVHVFYQQAALAPAAAGIVAFTVPYENLSVKPPVYAPAETKRPRFTGLVETRKRWYSNRDTAVIY